MPKIHGCLCPKIYGFENLYEAHRRARKGGKRQRPEVAEFEQDLGENLLRLGFPIGQGEIPLSAALRSE